jgi:hypothetical protein
MPLWYVFYIFISFGFSRGPAFLNQFRSFEIFKSSLEEELVIWNVVSKITKIILNAYPNVIAIGYIKHVSCFATSQAEATKLQPKPRPLQWHHVSTFFLQAFLLHYVVVN